MHPGCLYRTILFIAILLHLLEANGSLSVRVAILTGVVASGQTTLLNHAVGTRSVRALRPWSVITGAVGRSRFGSNEQFILSLR
jgi:hypothetical protein